MLPVPGCDLVHLESQTQAKVYPRGTDSVHQPKLLFVALCVPPLEELQVVQRWASCIIRMKTNETLSCT